MDSKTLFNLYIKSNNNSYILPGEISQKFVDTISTINRIDYLNSSTYYNNLLTAFTQYLTPDFEYLLTVGLYSSLISAGNVVFNNSYIKNIIELMSKKGDPLKDIIFPTDNLENINKLLNNYVSPVPTKMFEFLGNNFVGQSAWVAKNEQLPDQMKLIELYMKARNLLLILEKNIYVDAFLQKELQKFLNDFSDSFANLTEIKKFVENFEQDGLLRNDINVWRKIIGSISDSLGTINEFIKPYSIKSDQELNQTLNVMNYLNLSTKDPTQFYMVILNMGNDKFKNLIDDLMITGAQLNVNNSELIKNISKDMYSTFVGILATHFKKAIRTGDLKYGDCFHFLQVYSLSSILLELLNNNKINTIEYNNVKQQLKNLLITKKFANNMVNLLDNPDKNIVISTLEVIRRMGNKVAPWVIQKSPDMPKNKSFWVRLNLWSKIYNSLDKNDPKYNNNKQYMLNKLRNILSSYSDTAKFSIFINSLVMNENNFDIFVKNLDSILNTIAGFPIANSYEDTDYLYSQNVRLSFLNNDKNNNNQFMKTTIHNELITKIITKDQTLNVSIMDFNDYKMNLKNVNNLESQLYKVLSTFYGASMYSS
ncbi:MAG: hypothetical protein NZM44_07525 [Candidatus Calescibacterium sp.]|nr:hypothetical protein [Candidatus Calescibacterium sp.]